MFLRVLTKILHTLTLSTLKLPDSGKMDTGEQTSKECKTIKDRSGFMKLTVVALVSCRLTTGLCNEVGEEVFVAVLFAHDSCADERRGFLYIVKVVG